MELCKAAVTSAAFPAGWRACLERSTCKTMRLSAHSHSEEIRMVCLRQRMIENLRVRQLVAAAMQFLHIFVVDLAPLP